MSLIDSHCHFDLAAFDGRREALLDECHQQGLEALIVPGLEPQQWLRLQQLLGSHQASPCRLYAAAGLHPWWVKDCPLTPAQVQASLAQQLTAGEWVALGETGLDGSIDCPMERQQAYLSVQLTLATDLNKPLILHAHQAHNPLLQLLSRYRPPAGGVIHAFSGSPEIAQQYWRLGFYLGVGGTITYGRAHKTRRALATMSLDALLLETDAPDMPLSGCQGQPNSPVQLPLVAQCLAELQGLPLARVQQQTTANTRQLFGLV